MDGRVIVFARKFAKLGRDGTHTLELLSQLFVILCTQRVLLLVHIPCLAPPPQVLAKRATIRIDKAIELLI